MDHFSLSFSGSSGFTIEGNQMLHCQSYAFLNSRALKIFIAYQKLFYA
jgi:hypothetical protein